MSLKLVPPTPEPEPTPAEKVRRRVVASTPKHMVVCACGSTEFIETRTGMTKTATGHPEGGSKTLICLHCLMQRNRRVEAPT